MRKKSIASNLIALPILIAVINFTSPCYSFRELRGNILSYPVLIVLDNNSFGSGFYRKKDNNFFLVTAKHVLFEYPHSAKIGDLPSDLKTPNNLRYKFYLSREEGKLIFDGKMSAKEKEQLLTILPENDSFRKAIEILYQKSRKPLKLKSNAATLLSYRPKFKESSYNIGYIDLNELYKDGKISYHPSSDVAAINYGKVMRVDGKADIIETYGVKWVSKEKQHTVSVHDKGFKTFDQVLVSNDVYLFGYPTSLSNLSPDLDIKLPLLRKGIVAGMNRERKIIIIDCPVFFGNSGGLVVEKERIDSKEERYLAIGIVSKMVPYADKWIENSGYTIVVPMDQIEELLSN